MDVPVTPPAESATVPRFVTEFDGVPGFWNTLLAFDRDDLIAELVQNDLDQDATRTVISFEPDRMVCEGNGRPVEPDGWRRLGKGHLLAKLEGERELCFAQVPFVDPEFATAVVAAVCGEQK